ncbi:MAG TPA: hypothetical protein DGH68_10490 [Bacteroidetes bacterium]|jgi:polysaccharide biosynthesis/export protein|nr:hypothetical protein [Bacteroidota bacterium]
MKPILPPVGVRAITVLAALVFISCANQDSTKDSQQRIPPGPSGQPSFVYFQSDSTVVSVGDSLVLSVWDYPQFNTHANVRLNGAITVPLIGEIKVAGTTKEDLTRTLRRRLSDYIKGDVLLSLEVYGPAPKITVLGMVPNQGSFQANTELTLLEVISRAGGWTEFADLRYIKITRQSTSTSKASILVADLTSYMETGDPQGLPLVRPGDLVFVPKKENFVREFGAFLWDVILLFGFFGILN